MSATTTDQTAGNLHDFDAELDAFMSDATQRPDDAGMAGATPQDSEPRPATAGTATAPREGSAAPPASPTGEPAAQEEGKQEAEPIDWEARYRELEAKATSEAARELSAAGRLKKANEELARIQAERDDYKRRVDDQNARIDKWWEEAITAAPEEQKAEYRRQHALDQRERQLQQKQEEIALTEQHSERQREEVRQQATQAARFYATAELDSALEARAQHEGLPVELVKPVRDWVNSPYVKKLVQVLPLREATPDLPGDPADWDIEHIDDLNKLRTHLVAQAERGYLFYKQQHTEAKAKAEEARVAANAAAAQQTYQPEKPLGAAGGAGRKGWEEMDIDEALDAFLATPAR